jgi:SNF2 family DNA or RNA helicase
MSPLISIFAKSQFKIMLDIIEDYLHLRGFKVERIDGSITGAKRQAAIDRFQSKDKGSGREQPVIMLLSTRAGGVVINLTAADTCVSFIKLINCTILNFIYFTHMMLASLLLGH